MNNVFRYLLLFLFALALSAPAHATVRPTTGRPLATALNLDGTLRPGARGSFDARTFRMGIAPDGRPVFRPAGAAGAGDERWADGFGLPNGASGTVNAVVLAGTEVYIGGDFKSVGDIVANGVAKWNGTAWSSLGTGPANGVNGSVTALAIAGNGNVYAGGYFAQAGGVAASRVAKWNGTAWSPLGTGINGASSFIRALAIAGNGDVYVGGYFTQAGGSAANNVARWDGTAWRSLGTGAANGLNGTAFALAIASSGEVYVGGGFIEVGGTPANYLARWNGSAWSTVGTGASNGTNGTVYALTIAGNGDLYVGGAFPRVGGSVVANNVARWDGTAWSPLGTGPANGASNVVHAVAVAGNGDVYVGGSLVTPATGNYLAKWNGTAWSNPGAGAGNGPNYFVYALGVAGNGDLYAGGRFGQAGGASATRVAKWNGTAWGGLGTGVGNGMNDFVSAVAVAGNGDVYVGGDFTRAGGAPATRVARWNGTAWSPLGTGLGNGLNSYSGSVLALAVAGNGDVYAGGSFTQANGISRAGFVEKWNGTAWVSLGTADNGLLSTAVYALAIAGNGDVYAGGGFTYIGGTPANFVAKWNGTAWSPLGTGINGGNSGYVAALAVAGNGDVFAGGSFAQAGGVAANSIARWNGTAWAPLGTGPANGVNYFVTALAAAGNGDVYVGGRFGQAGGASANRIARWNGTAWSPLGTGPANGLDADVLALAVAGNGDVYAGWERSLAGGFATNHIGKWNGTVWSSLGTGLNGGVGALALGPTGQVYAGGSFATTGDGSKVTVHFAVYDPNLPLATAAAPSVAPAVLFPNPAHGAATLRLPPGAPRRPLTLSDALGRVVRRYPAPAGAEAVLDLRGLPAGAYVVRCGQVSQRLVVE